MMNVAFKFALALTAVKSVFGFDNSRNDNVAAYWGQNSYGATHGNDPSNWQKTLSFYCQDDSIDAFPVGFLNVAFDVGGLPSLDLANICSVNTGVFPGTELPDCSFLASDIQTCQSKGKIVTISIGGATGAVGFSSDSQAQQFADTVWNLFLGGSSSTRPFGAAVLDGVDLDLEGGSATGWPAFVTRIRSHASGASKQYYITGAPQCPYPDAWIGSVLNAVGFDAVYVQFYNNPCGLPAFGTDAFDFSTWDNWAKTVSPNKNVKVYLGAPGAALAANNGYVSASQLATIAQQTRSQYSSFGGVMLWDASQAYVNGRFDAAIKQVLKNGGGSTPTSPTSAPPPPPPGSTTHTSTPPATSTPASGGSCGSVAPWQANIAYEGGDLVTYNGHTWTAKWWSEGDTPGGSAGDWTDDGPCVSAKVSKTNYRTKEAHASIPATAQVNPTATASATKTKASEDAGERPVRHSRFFGRQ
ncbi:glycoside hydrolase [Dentipellis sp. KUC8613]|nr:glycoside hydrolase [Dentipellis sp. KUC8613]